MRPAPFDYSRPQSLDEAVAALADGGTALAGGQTLMPALKRRLARPQLLVDLNRVEGLGGIEAGAGGRLAIGGMTRHQELADSPRLRGALAALSEAAERIADVQVRGRGTIGGSVCAADPRANLPAALLALEARVALAGPAGERTLALPELFLDVASTALARGEVLVRVELDPGATVASSYDELTVQPNSPPIVNAAVAAHPDGGFRFAVGGLLRTPWRATELDSAIEAGADRAAVLAVLREAAAGRPRFEDMHGDAEFRLGAAATLISRALARVVERLEHGEGEA